MRKNISILISIITLTLAVLILTKCKKEEFIIVYSKVKTVRAFNITSTTASLEGAIDSLTSAAHDEYGFCLDTLANPTAYKQKLLASGIVQLGTFSSAITGLKPSTTYHVRAFIKDNKKYLYGSDVSFKTSAAVLPTVSTNSVSEIKATTAVCGGNVTAAGDRTVIAKGVCYDTVASPTISKNKTTDGWGTGTYTSTMMNLIPEKTYYARAYAVSEFGVGYGTQKTFTTKKALYTFHEDFTNNTNEWYVGNGLNDTARIAGGEYVLAYQKSGYIWRVYNDFPDFEAVDSKDFEISTKIRIEPYNIIEAIGTSKVGGIIWNSDNTHFKYFIVKEVFQGPFASPSFTYSYQIGTYNGSYTIWKDYTSFTGTNALKLNIKKANSKYYFFINDVQVFSYSYESISYAGVGFLIGDSRVYVDYLSIDQKDYKKSDDFGTIEMKSLPGGHSIIKSFTGN